MRRVTRSDPDLRHLKRRETDRRDPLEDARVVTDGGTHTAGHLGYCDECVSETLHHRDETDGMWTCASCGRWSA